MIRRDITDIEFQPSLHELKEHLRILSNDQDDLLMSYLKAAARSAEHHIGRCLETSEFTLMAEFSQSVELPEIDSQYFPLMEVLSVEADGQAVPAEHYSVAGGTLTFAEGVTGSTLKIKYKAGGYPVEDDIKAAIKLTASKYFNNPVDSVETLPSVATNLLRPYRRWGQK